MPTIISVANQKGGVGKTTLATSLAAALVDDGRKALLVDLDPQANATRILGVDTAELPTMADLMLTDESGHQLREVVVATEWGVDLAPSEATLARRDLQRGDWGDEAILRDTLTEGLDGYDAILIDCPPHLGLLTVNALTASHQLLLVTDPAIDALAGLSRLQETADTIRTRYNPELRVAGVAVNKADRTRVGRARLREVREHFGDDQVLGVIPARAVMREALERGIPLHQAGRSARPLADTVRTIARRLVDA